MTIIYKGIRRKTTAVLADYGQAHYMQNVRLKRLGEMGRRAGLGKSNMAQLAGPVTFMIGGWNYQPYIVNGTGGSVTGNEDPLSFWTGATMQIPGGMAGQPQAPVITAIVASPASPQAWIVGQVTFTATITYDGLSGPLLYSWSSPIGPANPIPVSPNTNPGIFDFDGNCIPGTYGIELLVTTTDDPFLNGTLQVNYEVV